MGDRQSPWGILIAAACIAAVAAYLLLAVGDTANVPMPAPAAPARAPAPTPARARPIALASHPYRAALPAKPDLRLLFVGDSLRAGFFATTPARTYVARVTAAIRRRHPHAVALDATEVVNTGNGFRRASSIKQVPAGVDLAVVEVGTNDVADADLGRFHHDYAALLRRIRRISPSARILCLSVWQGGPPIDSRRIAYNSVISSSCTHGLYVDITTFALDAGMHGPAGRVVGTATRTSDSFHPNDAGHQAIADAILDHVRY